MARQVAVVVNGRRYSREVEVWTSLADFVRDDLGLTGTHVGCEHGVCGSCTLLLDDEPVRSCLVLAVQADGCAVSTVEGLAAEDGTLHPLQQAFHTHHAVQCGFCTSGILLSSLAFLREQPRPSEQDVREMLAGSFCRCTGYQHIVDAILAAAATMRGDT